MPRILVIAALLLAGCSSGTATPTPAPATPTPTPSPVATATPSATPTAAPTPAPTAAASGALTIHLIERVESGASVTVFSLTDCHCALGDYIVGFDPLVDATTNRDVGTLAYECFLVGVSDMYHCPGNTITLTDRGQIVFTELIHHVVGGATIAPISGGTGEFLGVTGTVTSRKVDTGGDFVITITK
jgi:hypothetical protein